MVKWNKTETISPKSIYDFFLITPLNNQIDLNTIFLLKIYFQSSLKFSAFVIPLAKKQVYYLNINIFIQKSGAGERIMEHRSVLISLFM